jgi:MoaA/NifB/PqqE/SkfB family radical SAM enzyme
MGDGKKTMSTIETPQEQKKYGLRAGAEEFPLMIVMSIIYPCNFGCPMCPYTDGNSEIRKFYRERDGDLFPVDLWKSIADEAGEYGAWMRCTGGGEPMLHPNLVEMIEYAKERGARIWLNTNGSMFGPSPKHREKLERVIRAGIDLIEFSMDAADAELYAKLRPPRGGMSKPPQEWWDRQVSNVTAALEMRKRMLAPTRVVVSIIRQEEIEGKLEEAIDFWLHKIGVDEVITRKFLTWDDNTTIPVGKALDKHLYADLPTEKKQPCVWPFERLNVDTLGRISLCGQDISFRSSEFFPNANQASIKEIWRGEMFDWYRKMHLEGRGAECFPCRGCSAWFAGIRDWEHGWLKVLKKSGDHLKQVMSEDLGVEVQIYEPTV